MNKAVDITLGDAYLLFRVRVVVAVFVFRSQTWQVESLTLRTYA